MGTIEGEKIVVSSRHIGRAGRDREGDKAEANGTRKTTGSKLVKLSRVCDVVDAGRSLNGHADVPSQKYGNGR